MYYAMLAQIRSVPRNSKLLVRKNKEGQPKTPAIECTALLGSLARMHPVDNSMAARGTDRLATT